MGGIQRVEHLTQRDLVIDDGQVLPLVQRADVLQQDVVDRGARTSGEELVGVGRDDLVVAADDLGV